MDDKYVIDAEAFARNALPPGKTMTHEVADSALDWHFPTAAIEQMRVLREKNSEGTLSPDEYELLDRYRRAGLLIDILKAEARLFQRGIPIDKN
jgi:hypothetical protein